MKFLGAIVVAALIFLSGAAAARAADDTPDDIHRKCAAEHADALSVTSCLKVEEADYGKRLAAAYKEVVDAQTPEAKQALAEAQKSWLQFQSQDCAFHKQVLSFNGAEHGEAAAALCTLRTTMQRLAELEALLPQLEH
jgi:uncharacterized protein YecT (DUF1311 family)